MNERKVSIVKEPDEATAPLAFACIALVVAWLAAFLAWVFWFRGYP